MEPGGTGDLALVYDDLQRRLGYDSKFVGVGYSMGALILLRFLGEDAARQEKFLCAFSFCQQYNSVRLVNTVIIWSIPTEKSLETQCGNVSLECSVIA